MVARRGPPVVALLALLAQLALFALLAVASLAAAAPPDGTVEESWWRHAVIYQIYPRSFKDSDGNGIGDLKGITSKLQYLKDIGVGAIWLSSFYKSPQADFGYDISDFRDVDPTYGTLADFKDMVDTAHALGLKVVVDLIPGHSSDEHEWFQRSARREEPYTDYYVWKDKKGDDESGKPIPPNNWKSYFRFSTWQWNDERQQFYLHMHHIKQPDLNYTNEHVVREMKDVYKFWLDQGVDGFRVDALPVLVEDHYDRDEPPKADPSPDLDAEDADYYDHPYTMDQPLTYDMLRQWRELVDAYDAKPRVIMTECYTSFNNTMRYYGESADKPAAHFPMNFQLIMYTGAATNASAFKAIIDEWLGAMDMRWRWPNWVLGNHDNKRVATRFPDMADAMNMMLLTLPGTAVAYYGEELGMTDAFISWAQTRDPPALNAGADKYLRVSRDPARTPMQWDDSTSAGFSTNRRTWMPSNPNYVGLNVRQQAAARKSHLGVYKDLLEARKGRTLRQGDWRTDVIGENVLAISRSLAGSETFVTLLNVGSWTEMVSAADLAVVAGSGSYSVYTAGVNSALSKGDAVPPSLEMRPKEALLLVASGRPL